MYCRFFARRSADIGAAMLMTLFLSISAEARSLDDTGLTRCIVDGISSGACANTGQDAEFGRDAYFPSNKNGQAGFRFTKLDARGESLPASAAAWSCVRDDVSGLTWEIKSAEPGLRYFNNIYSYSGANTFAATVNRKGLCGKNDWRLPTRLETDTLQLLSTHVSSGAYIDTEYFNDSQFLFWTSTLKAKKSAAYYLYDFRAGIPLSISIEDGFAPSRLTRGAPKDLDSSKRFVAIEDFVKDKLIGATWGKFSEGQQWNGTTCLGIPTLFTWQEALVIANEKRTHTGEPWRLPNLKELMSITAMPATSPSIDALIFPHTASVGFWTGSAVSRNGGATFNVWAVDFDTGFEYLEENTPSSTHSVRLIRSLD